MWKQMPCRGLIGRSVIKSSRPIPFKQKLQLPLLDKWLIISKPFHVIDSLFPSIPDTTIISKAMTQLSRQSHLTCPEAESCTLKTVSKLDNSSCPVVDNDPQLNPKCMTTLDWVEAQSKDKNIGEIICLFIGKELQMSKR